MLKKLCTLFISAGLVFGLTACSKTELEENEPDKKDNNVEEIDSLSSTYDSSLIDWASIDFISFFI